MSSLNPSQKFNAEDLLQFAYRILKQGGLDSGKAQIVAKTLLESDLMGHPTHGLALLHPYVKELESGGMNPTGEPEVIQDKASTLTWNGRHLPGAWLTHKAIDLALERIKSHPIITVVIRQSHHIGCLAAYPERATEKGLVLACADPKYNRVAPFGGLTGVYSPNPIAAGFPTLSEPIIFDISTSATAGGVINKAYKENTHLPHPWLLDNQGNPTADPKTFFSETPSTILPLGGLDTGYKGFALGIMVDALTLALGGRGRADEPEGWESSVFLQIIDPEHFSGLDKFTRETQHLKDQCLASTTPPNHPPVRMPGDRALQLRAEQLKKGVRLDAVIVRALLALADKYQVSIPESLE